MKVLIVQSNSSISEPFGPIFQREGYEISVVDSPTPVLDAVRTGSRPDILLVDNALKQPSAIEVCRLVKTTPDYAIIPIIMLEISQEGSRLIEAVKAGVDDILTHPINPTVLLDRARTLVQIKNLLGGLSSSESVLSTLARTIETKDPYTRGHADRVSGFAVELGKALGVSGAELEVIRIGGLLHDVGKIAIPDAILTKPGKYTPDEFEIMKRHPALGCEICNKLDTVQGALPLIRHHHEKLDGTGYPDKLSGDQIPKAVRVVTIVDIYDALRSKRSYKEAFGLEKSFEIMWSEVEKGWWDREVLAAWEKVVRSKEQN